MSLDVGTSFLQAKGNVRIPLGARPLSTSALCFCFLTHTHSSTQSKQGKAGVGDCLSLGPTSYLLSALWDFTKSCP